MAPGSSQSGGRESSQEVRELGIQPQFLPLPSSAHPAKVPSTASWSYPAAVMDTGGRALVLVLVPLSLRCWAGSGDEQTSLTPERRAVGEQTGPNVQNFSA